MNANKRFVQFVLSLLIFLFSARRAAGELPVITAVELAGTNVLIHARVPAGFPCVTLETRRQFGPGAWIPRAVTRPGGQGGEVVFQIPATAPMELMRLRADAREPLPASFYTGLTEFMGVPTTVVDAGALAGGGPAGAEMVTGAGVDAARAVVESDIWNIRGDTLYFFNQSRGLQVIDLANADAPVLRGVLEWPASGERMYVPADDRVVLLTRAGCRIETAGNDSQVLLVDTAAGTPNVLTNLPVPGWIQSSRLVGTALYVVSQTFRPQPGSSNIWEWGSMVSSFDLSNAQVPVARATLWVSGYGNVVTATDRFLFLVTQDAANWSRTRVHVIDIRSADGTLAELAAIQTAGVVRHKFNLHLNGDTFTAVSESWSNTVTAAILENYSLTNPAAPVKVASLSLGEGVRLQATRFDGDRAYVATGLYVDPLTVVDLADPAQPRILGELDVPGFSTFIHPLGDRLVTLGLLSNRVAVSLFDVSTAPELRDRVLLGGNYSWSEANWDEQAFGVLPDIGLLLVPYQGYASNGLSSQVQLIDLGTNSLTLRGQIVQHVVPRRTAAYRDRILSLSGWELLSVDATDRDQPRVMARLELAWPVDRVFLAGNHLVQVTDGTSWGFPAAPALRVTLENAPHQVLNRLALTNLPVVGAARRGAHLFVAQAPMNLYPYLVATDGSGAPATNTSPFVLTVIGLDNLPQLPVLAQTNMDAAPRGWGMRVQAVWPKPDLLVWADYGNPWHIAVPGFVPFTTGIGAVDATSLIWPGYWPQRKQLLAVDVANPAAPVFQSRLIVSGTNTWNFSRAFATNGLVHFSHLAADYMRYTYFVAPADGSTETVGVAPSPEPEYWAQRHFLDVVDYADATVPTVRPPVSVPGELRGIARGGSLLYTVGVHWQPSDWWSWGEHLDASAYDGAAVHLVDSLALSRLWPHPVVTADTNVFVGQPGETGSTNTPPPMVETWTLDDTGRFVKLGGAAVESSAYALVTLPGLLATHEAAGLVGVFDRSNPAALLRLASAAPPGCVWPDLEAADGAPGRGVWIPLGGFGLMHVPLAEPEK
ncbi:MAG: beta-propeller domain-containing protein [Verrucomicrobiota bacterium]